MTSFEKSETGSENDGVAGMQATREGEGMRSGREAGGRAYSA